MTIAQENYIKSLASKALGRPVRYLSEIPRELTGVAPNKLATIDKTQASLIIDALMR